MKERNKAIGECPCPVKSCAEQMQVYRFRPRDNELQRRLAGKFYANCPVHGRFGADGKQGAIDYIAEYMTWLPESDGAAPEKPGEKPQNTKPETVLNSHSPAPEKAPESTEQIRQPHLWEM